MCVNMRNTGLCYDDYYEAHGTTRPNGGRAIKCNLPAGHGPNHVGGGQNGIVTWKGRG